MKIVSVREHPEFADAAIGYISACWPEVPPVLYEDCIRHAVSAAGPLPQWYLLMSGGEPDIERAAAAVLDEFRSGKLGRISLERP